MYFSPGKKVERSQEIWHENIWKESPRFRCAPIKINGVSYNCSDFVVYRESSNRIGRILVIVEVDGELKVTIQRVLQFIELPGNLQSNDRRERSPREVWLFDQNMENALVEVELQTIIKRVMVTILYTEDTIHDNSSVVIREILYKHQGHWKIRNVAYSYRHPSEFTPLKEPETNLPIYKLYIDLYFADFGMFRNVYHLLGGVYIQIGNLPFDKRKQLKNHFVLGFVPFGGSFEEFIAPFVAEMKTLENGKIMDVQGTKSIVIASLEDITADLPQGNDLVGVLAKITKANLPHRKLYDVRQLTFGHSDSIYSK
ncbi:hypothetical protein C1646_678324 [Rhizophagus diaphanus]|nr:hypothetical protein C1646_678324 [Rhizophagus diaphanus] [Rhizophagus sp. MUCL 43196]